MRTCCVQFCNEKDSRNNKHSFHRLPNDPETRAKWLSKINRPNFQPPMYTFICSKHFVESDYEVQFGKRSLKKGVVPSILPIVKPPQEEEFRRRPNILKRLKITETNEKLNELLSAITSQESDLTFPVVDVKEENGEKNDKSTYRIISNVLLNSCKVEDKSEDVFQMTINEDEMEEENGSYELEPTRKLRYEGDFIEDDMEEPRKARKYFHLARRKLSTITRKLKTTQQTNRRMRKKFFHIKLLIDELTKNDLITKQAEGLLKFILPDKIIEQNYSEEEDIQSN